jgi:hypothetical protein
VKFAVQEKSMQSKKGSENDISANQNLARTVRQR